MQKLLTEVEVAEMLHVSTKTVRRIRMPRIRIGRVVRYSLADVTKFVEARRFSA